MRLIEKYSAGDHNDATIVVKIDDDFEKRFFCNEFGSAQCNYYNSDSWSLGKLTLSELEELGGLLEKHIPTSLSFKNERDRFRSLVGEFIHRLKISQDPKYKISFQLKESDEKLKKLQETELRLRSEISGLSGEIPALKSRIYELEDALVQILDINSTGGPGHHKNTREIILRILDEESVRERQQE